MRRKRFSPIVIMLISAIAFSSIGFMTAYYKYSKEIAQEKIERKKEQQLLQALINAQQSDLYNASKSNEKTVTSYNDIIDNKTQLIYKTLYTQCEHIIEENQQLTPELIGLNNEGLQKYLKANQLDLEIESFSKESVVLIRKIDKICPNHYLISVDKGYIAIYKYDKHSNKEILEKTDIPINILPVVDQERLQEGILLETMEEVNQLLEDYSS